MITDGFMLRSPLMMLSFVLLFAVIFVNGWTDVPNAIASAVGSRSMKMKNAVILASVMNFFGVFLAVNFQPAVTQTVISLIEFSDERQALFGLCAVMLSVVIWSVIAWYFGIPTSESHALTAGFAGINIAINSNLSGMKMNAWTSTLFGLVAAIVLSFLLCSVCVVFLQKLVNKSKNIPPDTIFVKGQIVTAAGVSFLHGVQDGQKFAAVFIMLLNFNKVHSINVQNSTIIIAFFCALLMSVGTAFGGGRIVNNVGNNITKLNSMQGFASDIGSSLVMALCSLLGVPVSTTHVKTMGIVGAGIAGRNEFVNWKLIREMLCAWLFTFPICAMLSYLLIKLLFVLA